VLSWAEHYHLLSCKMFTFSKLDMDRLVFLKLLAGVVIFQFVVSSSSNLEETCQDSIHYVSGTLSSPLKWPEGE
jgi:hypothetical protein